MQNMPGGGRMKDIPQDDIARVARSVVASVAPEELLLFRLHSEEFFRDPVRAMAKPQPKEDAMGFGAGDVVQLATPFVLMALTEVVRALKEEAMQQIGNQARDSMRGLVQHLFGGTRHGSEWLTREQLKRVHEVALANAGQDPERAKRIADGIVAALSLPTEAANSPAKPPG
jgi:hypothetical protein